MLFLLLLAGLGWRALGAARATLIEEDGAFWASLAGALARGDWAHGLSTAWPPAYPALIGALAWLARAASSPAMLEGCARAISVLAGTLMLVPLHRLARRLVPEPYARAVLVLAAFHPRLVSYSAMALSEMTFTLFLIAGLAALASAEEESVASRARQAREGLAGAAFGLSYLARPEGLLLAAGLWLVGLVRARGRSLSQRLRPAFLLALIAVALPYVLFLHARLGGWSLGEKGGYNFWRAYRSEYAQIYPPPVNLARRVNESPELSGDLAPERVHVAGFTSRRPGTVAATTLGRLARLVFDTVPITVYWPFALLALLAVLGARSGPWWIVATPLALSPLLYAPFSTDRRFFVPLVPLLLIACGQALWWLDRRWPRAAALEPPRFGRPARIATLVLVLYSLAWSGWLLRERHPAAEHRAMGDWLWRERPRNAGPGDSNRPVIAARKPWVAFYAGGLIAELPDPLPGELRQRARDGRPWFVVADARAAASDRPHLAPLLDAAHAPPGLRLVHRIEAPAPILLYRVEPDSAAR